MVGSSAQIDDKAGVAPSRSPAPTSNSSGSSARQAFRAPPMVAMPPTRMVRRASPGAEMTRSWASSWP